MAQPLSAKPIDTLYLSPLLFPERPYHALLKDDKLQTDELNNPLNDAEKARRLFYDEVNAFSELSARRKDIYYGLLNSLEEFQGFFSFMEYRPLFPDPELAIRQELLLEIYGVFESAWSEGLDGPKAEDLREILYWYVSDYSEVIMERRIRQQVDPGEDFCTGIVMEADLSDNRFLYAYGEYVTVQEEKMADYLRSLPQERIQLIADTYTEGYRRGFELAGIDLSKKKTVNIRYHVGFERIIRAAVKNFERMGLKPVIYRQAVSMLEIKV